MGWKGKGNSIWQDEAEPYIIPRPLNCLITTAKFILLNYYSYKLIKCLLHIWEKQKVIIPPKPWQLPTRDTCITIHIQVTNPSRWPDNCAPKNLNIEYTMKEVEVSKKLAAWNLYLIISHYTIIMKLILLRDSLFSSRVRVLTNGSSMHHYNPTLIGLNVTINFLLFPQSLMVE